MSQENVEVVRRAHGALARGDTEGFVREMTEDVEGMSRVMAVEGVTYRGHDGMRRFVDEMQSVFPDFRSEIVRAVEGDNVVVAELRFSGTGAGSGLATEGRTWQALILRDGRICSWRAYETEAEALEAVGLSE
jgi:ketosteroid isomerase-like protein